MLIQPFSFEVIFMIYRGKHLVSLPLKRAELTVPTQCKDLCSQSQFWMKILLNNNARKGLLTPRLKKTRMQSQNNQKQNRAFEQTSSAARKTVFSCSQILFGISRRVHEFTRMRLV